MTMRVLTYSIRQRGGMLHHTSLQGLEILEGVAILGRHAREACHSRVATDNMLLV